MLCAVVQSNELLGFSRGFQTALYKLAIQHPGRAYLCSRSHHGSISYWVKPGELIVCIYVHD